MVDIKGVSTVSVSSVADSVWLCSEIRLYFSSFVFYPNFNLTTRNLQSKTSPVLQGKYPNRWLHLLFAALLSGDIQINPGPSAVPSDSFPLYYEVS